MSFDRNASSIAVTVPWFTLKKASLGPPGPLRRLGEAFADAGYNEPYLVTLAIDAHGRTQQAIDFNFAYYPNVKPGQSVEMLGHGHLVYGPAHPGEFVAVSVLAMESDQDVRELGARLRNVVQSKAADIGLKALLAANPQAGMVASLLAQLADLVAGELAHDRDDPLFRTSGVFLRDMPVPFDVNRQVTHGNDFIDLALKVIPLETPNGQGPQTDRIAL